MAGAVGCGAWPRCVRARERTPRACEGRACPLTNYGSSRRRTAPGQRLWAAEGSRSPVGRCSFSLSRSGADCWARQRAGLHRAGVGRARPPHCTPRCRVDWALPLALLCRCRWPPASTYVISRAASPHKGGCGTAAQGVQYRCLGKSLSHLATAHPDARAPGPLIITDMYKQTRRHRTSNKGNQTPCTFA